MTNTAILVGNSDYQSLDTLTCCHNDLEAMKELLEATDKYDDIEIIENAEADHLKSQIRESVNKTQSREELFFYFTGHGFACDDEFYHCATGFDAKRPNETGLSTNELHTLLRNANSNLVVKVIDACNSGTLLVKENVVFQSQQKHGFNNLIQISSCCQSQNSFAGEPLSVFTDKFRAATLRKREGTIYYMDIIGSLRDEFIQNNEQTPFFVSQGTGREKFVETAQSLDGLRAQLVVTGEPSIEPEASDSQGSQTESSLQVLLDLAERNIVTPEIMRSFVDEFFDDLIQRASNDEFSAFFDWRVTDYSEFSEPTTTAFITGVLSRESRPDEFVTAVVERSDSYTSFAATTSSVWDKLLGQRDRGEDSYNLQLNCEMGRAQLKISLLPKYHSLKKLIVVITCAPSLHHCYIFEMCTEHSLTDFGEFNDKGREISRRWWRCPWQHKAEGIVGKIVANIDDAVRAHLAHTQQKLSSED